MLKPHFISTDLQPYHRDILDYSATSGIYQVAIDGAIDDKKFTSSASTFTDKHIGLTIAIDGVGYALINARENDHTLTLDTSFGKASGARFCVGAFASVEKTAFDMMKYEILNGYDNKVFAVAGPGLRKITGNYDLDFIAEIADDAITFKEAHLFGTLYRIFLEQSIQGGENWKVRAYDFGKMYYGFLATAIHTFARELKDGGTVAGIQQKNTMVFGSMYRR